MQRSYSTPAVIISIRPLGENNSSVTLLTPEKGIIYATLYGGPKSKMKSLVLPWNSGILYLYDNQEKNQLKITDFDVKNYHQSFSQNLFKMYAASFAAEIVVKTHCGGSNEECFRLFSGLLDGMELSGEEESRVGLIRFLWRYLELLGVQSDATCCGECNKSFIDSEFALTGQTYYNEVENFFVCSECASGIHYNFNLDPLALRYLAGISLLKPSEVRQLKITKESFDQLRSLLFYLIEKNVDSKINSLETGLGIL